MMEIRKINKDVHKIISESEYLGCGASKEAYLKNDIVYKIPRGDYLITRTGLDLTNTIPDKMEEVNNFLTYVESFDEAMVWPVGQFAIELIIWKAVEELQKEGLAINCFAPIKDYYLDNEGVLIIEQEAMNTTEAPDLSGEELNKAYDAMRNELELLEPILFERFGIKLRDVRKGNCGIDKEGKYRLFDFGISTTTDLDSYGSYSDYAESYNSYDSWCSDSSY